MVCSQSQIGIDADDVLSVDLGIGPVANSGHDHVFVPDLRAFCDVDHKLDRKLFSPSQRYQG